MHFKCVGEIIEVPKESAQALASQIISHKSSKYNLRLLSGLVGDFLIVEFFSTHIALIIFVKTYNRVYIDAEYYILLYPGPQHYISSKFVVDYCVGVLGKSTQTQGELFAD